MELMTTRPQMSCDKCRFRKTAENRPTSILGRLWIWHTAFCPGWKRYVTTLYEFGENPPRVGSDRGLWDK